MARSRNIKPGFYKNEELAECSIWARHIFPGLWMLADREGRLEDRPKRIKGELLPFDGQDMEALLSELDTRKFILRYENADGRFIQILKFKEHQSPHYSEKKSVIKPPNIPELQRDEESNTPRKHPDNSGSDPGLMRGSQPPDVLIPDSGFLIPDPGLSDSPNPSGQGISSSETEREPAADRPAPPAESQKSNPTPAAKLAESLRLLGVDAKSTAPQCKDWAQRSIPITTLTEAVHIARQRKPGETIPVAYLAPIVEELLAGPGTGQAASPTLDMSRWWKSNEGIKAKGEELGFVYEFRQPGDFIGYKARVFYEAGDGPWVDERDTTTFRLVNELRQAAQA